MNNVSIIRDRGQLTIPDDIRNALSWVTPMSAVSISIVNPQEIVIRPYQQKKDIDWDKLWVLIKRSRSFKGKSEGNLSAFIAKDRESRR